MPHKRTTQIALVKQYPTYNLYRATNRNGASELFKLNKEHAHLLEVHNYYLVPSMDGHRVTRRLRDENGKLGRWCPLGKDVMGVAGTSKGVIVDHINHNRNDYREDMMKVTDYSGNCRNRKPWKWGRKLPKYIYLRPPGHYMVLIKNKSYGTRHTLDEAITLRDEVVESLAA